MDTGFQPELPPIPESGGPQLSPRAPRKHKKQDETSQVASEATAHLQEQEGSEKKLTGIKTRRKLPGKEAGLAQQKIKGERPLPTPDSPEVTRAKEAFAIRAQALIRGQNVRNKVVLPDQIESSVTKNLLSHSSPKNRQNAVRLLCRKLNEMSLNPAQYKGKSVKIEAYSTDMGEVFTDPESLKTRRVQFPFDLILEMDAEGKKISILIPQGKIGEGGYKEVFKAQEFEVARFLKEGGEREVGHVLSVLVHQLDPKDKADALKIAQGMEIQKKLLAAVKERQNGVKIAEVQTPVLPRATDSQVGHEHKRRWYNCALLHAVTNASIPVGMDPASSSEHPIKIEDLLSVLADIADGLDMMHEMQLVHRDVKLENILLAIEEKGDVGGYLADFDLAEPIQDNGREKNYVYMDPLARKGYTLPITDCYGLVLAVGEALIPDFERRLLDNPRVLLNDKTRQKELAHALARHAGSAFDSLADPIADKIKAEVIKHLKAGKSANEAIRKVNHAIKGQRLSAGAQTAWNRLSKELVALESAFELIVNTIGQIELFTQDFQDYIERGEEQQVFDFLKQGGALEEISSEAPYAATIGQRIRQIKSQLESTKS